MAEDAKEEGGGQAETVAFEHKLFSAMENPYFRLSAQNPDQPVMIVTFGDNEVALPFESIRKEFAIKEGSADDQMLNLVAEGLNFVVLLRPGDPIPAELLTGAPSAQISREHREIAFQRLTMQLATWVAGEESSVTDRKQLARIAKDPAIMARINDALGEAATHLGLEPDGKEKVLQLIERLADDLAAIEVLRDRFAKIRATEEKIKVLRGVTKSQQVAIELIAPVARMMATAVARFGNDFKEVDARTDKIIALLKNIDSQVSYIRERRNDLHRRLLAWADILEAWDEAEIGQNDTRVRLLRETYRFLAPRFMPVDEWTLRSKLQVSGDTEVDQRQSETNHGLAKTEVVW
ncbi:MAG: hypothetical protein QNJ06_19670 [Kiloniellales bacterium]|nr:hypothetical protein [Kiloniellales bacterium]MDJ0972122.1 hypothetical protein [Kiloniellales bacterium]